MNFDKLVERIKQNRANAVKAHNQMARETLQRIDAVKQSNQQLAIQQSEQENVERKRKKKKG